ncbi:hypothetical protein C7974DRAFT_399339 [Boeremia exigua]|uniref:uncharacterized protein n=1 Tax=Boeremia exigua TaxID=749465 RepID=UPI001E8D511D|nr:uncharacterized protein C7974DRAFT_399339 [Boeremia exigua]KAH6620271.1 hypothetical protein C7974DRAFT_399339 [Boeremia exigua]
MRTKIQLLTLLFSTVLARPQQLDGRQLKDPVATNYHDQPSSASGRAVYFMTNDAENAVVALPIGRDGLLSRGTVTKTDGAGSNFINSATGLRAAPDALSAQSSLVVAGDYVFAVNAGSNTVTMMAISRRNPTNLVTVGQATLPGEFPTTIAASVKNQLVCVGTTGALAGISCATFNSSGMSKMDALRPFRLNQTTPPHGPLNSVAETFFSLDESTLFTTVKGDPTKNDTGFLSAFAVRPQENGKAGLASEDTRSSPTGTAVLFGSALVPNRPQSLFVTDASFGAVVLALDAKNVATIAGKQSIPGQKATCWATISTTTDSAFVADAGFARIVEMSTSDATIISELDLSADGDPGFTDLKASGNFVYVLSPGNGTTVASVKVLDISGGQGSMKLVQCFSLDGVAGQNSQGMAVLD